MVCRDVVVFVHALRGRSHLNRRRRRHVAVACIDDLVVAAHGVDGRSEEHHCRGRLRLNARCASPSLRRRVIVVVSSSRRRLRVVASS